MTHYAAPQVHLTAVVSADTELAPGVQIGAKCVIEGQVRLGAGCRLEADAYLFGPLSMGRDNLVHSHAILGEGAQSVRGGDGLGVEIGHGNRFRARVTVHQGLVAPTRVGNGNRFFAGSHVGHDCSVGNDCVFAADSLLGGHCQVGHGVRMGRRSALHQFCRLGRLARLLAGALSTKDVPPFILQHRFNAVAGVNVARMRRAGLSVTQVAAVEQIYQLLYCRGLTLSAALGEVSKGMDGVDVVEEFLDFVRSPGRGINSVRPLQSG
jgi:UDP-N-acetylglucosamine acyltransferase